MSNLVQQHKNFESDTVHGHATFEAEKNAMRKLPDKENHQNQAVNGNKLCDEYENREMQKEKENVAKKAEYRDFLLKQMSDKGKKTLSPAGVSALTPFSEELLDATERSNLKLQKQKEAKQNLDDCVKMKQNVKLQTKRTELEEAQKRSEFWKKRDDDTIYTLEKVKQKTEQKENTKNEVALLWMAEKHKDSQREKFVDALIEKESTIMDLNKHHKDLIEIQKIIRTEKALLKENEEKINEWLKNIDLVRKEQEQIKADLEKNEELERKLKEMNSCVDNPFSSMHGPGVDEVDQRKRVLQERNHQCANNRFFGID